MLMNVINAGTELIIFHRFYTVHSKLVRGFSYRYKSLFTAKYQSLFTVSLKLQNFPGPPPSLPVS